MHSFSRCRRRVGIIEQKALSIDFASGEALSAVCDEHRRVFMSARVKQVGRGVASIKRTEKAGILLRVEEFEVNGTKEVKGAVEALAIVEGFDVIEDLTTCIIPIFELHMMR